MFIPWDRVNVCVRLGSDSHEEESPGEISESDQGSVSREIHAFPP